MLPHSLLKIVITGALGLHAFAHATAIGALVGQATGATTNYPVRSWLVPGLSENAAAAVAIPVWAFATVAFALAALAFWRAATGEGWRRLAVAGAVASLLGIGLFFGTWPGSPDVYGFYALLNTGVATMMNLVILVSQLWLHWPPQPMSAK